MARARARGYQNVVGTYTSPTGGRTCAVRAMRWRRMTVCGTEVSGSLAGREWDRFTRGGYVAGGDQALVDCPPCRAARDGGSRG
jgi:hypothetical protein